MKTLQVKSSVGQDGVLELRIPLGFEEAGREVTVTVETSSVKESAASLDDAEWHRILRETYGACAGMGLERPEQGEFELRDIIE
jgi:hypothetical protein